MSAGLGLPVDYGPGGRASKGVRAKQHHLLADDLESILYGHSQSPTSPALRNLIAIIPEDRERSIPLLSVREPVRGLEDVVLSPENVSAVKEILREHNREEVLRAHGWCSRAATCGCVPNTWKRHDAARTRDGIEQGRAEPFPCRR